jgi:hypothetical protein
MCFNSTGMMHNPAVVTIRDVARLVETPLVVMSYMINQNIPVYQQEIERNPQAPSLATNRFVSLSNGEPAEQVSLPCTDTILRRSCGCSDENLQSLQMGGETHK